LNPVAPFLQRNAFTQNLCALCVVPVVNRSVKGGFAWSKTTRLPRRQGTTEKKWINMTKITFPQQVFHTLADFLGILELSTSLQMRQISEITHTGTAVRLDGVSVLNVG
jgi:hypothetical protein